MTASVPPAPAGPAELDDRPAPHAGEASPAFAAWARRLVGMLLDLSLVTMATWLIAGEVPILPPAPGWSPGTDEASWPETLSGPWWGLAALYVGLVCLQAYTGATPGKAAVGIRVIGERTGRPVGATTTVLRWMAHLLDAILFIGYLRPLWHPRRQTFADSLLTTVVVRTAPGRVSPWRTAAIVVTTASAVSSLVSAGGGGTIVETTASCAAPDGAAISVTYEREESWRMRGFIRRDRPATWSARVDVQGIAPDAQRVELSLAERTWSIQLLDGSVQFSGGVPGAIDITIEHTGPSDASDAAVTVRARKLDLGARTAPLRLAVADAAGTAHPLCTVIPDDPPAAATSA